MNNNQDFLARPDERRRDYIRPYQCNGLSNRRINQREDGSANQVRIYLSLIDTGEILIAPVDAILSMRSASVQSSCTRDDTSVYPSVQVIIRSRMPSNKGYRSLSKGRNRRFYDSGVPSAVYIPVAVR